MVEKVVRTSKSWRAGRRLRRLGHGLYCRSPAAARGQRRERGIWLAETFCSRESDDAEWECASEGEGALSFLYVEKNGDAHATSAHSLFGGIILPLPHAQLDQRISSEYGRCEFIRHTVWVKLSDCGIEVCNSVSSFVALCMYITILRIHSLVKVMPKG